MAAMFGNALGYEELMGRWSIKLASKFLDFAEVADGSRVLDVGCGTGSLAISLLDRMPKSEIVGIDPANQFVEYARSRVKNPRARFDIGDAMGLPYPSHSFDSALSLLVLMFLPDPEKGAAEMHRVTRPGGRAAACTWDRHGLELSEIFWQEAAKIDPSGESRSQRPNHSNRKGQLGVLWNGAGFTEVEETALEIVLPFMSFDDFWAPHTKGVAPQGQFVSSLNAESREALRQGLRKRLLGDGPDRPFQMKGIAWAVRGKVPQP